MPRSEPVVLIVDDQEDSAAMYAFGLLAMGFEPITARTAHEAFEQACLCQPDAVVADLTLGGASGLDLTRQLRANALTSNVVILVLTGHDGAAVEREAYAAGCDRFLVKPCLPDVLALEIRSALVAGHAS
jgi:DNA-binding response OmpR family regulator